MYAAIRRHYYWESMAADEYDWMASCASCARNRMAPRRRTEMLKLFPATDPFASLSMDLLGPLTETKAGNVFLLIIVDRFSKLVRAVPWLASPRQTSRRRSAGIGFPCMGPRTQS